MLPKSDVWEKCDGCGLWWDTLRLDTRTVLTPTHYIWVDLCPMCRGISNWADKVDKDGRC